MRGKGKHRPTAVIAEQYSKKTLKETHSAPLLKSPLKNTQGYSPHIGSLVFGLGSG